MKNKTKVLASSALAIAMSASLAIGGTYALFTSEDSVNIAVTSGKVEVTATIKDVTLYSMGVEQTDTFANGGTATVADDEITLTNVTPGDKAVVTLDFANNSNVAIQYRMGVTMVGELAQYLTLTDESNAPLAMGYTLWETLEAGVAPADDSLTFAIELPEAETKGQGASATISVFVEAVQGNAEVVNTYSTTEAVQAALDNAKAGDTIQLQAGVNYGTLYLGRPTKNNDTQMTCDTHSYTTTNAEEFVAHLAESGYHTTPKYVTTVKDLKIIGAEGATVAGLVATSGHAYGDVYDYVRDKDYDVGSAYYNTLTLQNITFEKVNFIGKVDINTSDADSVYDGITFSECTFTTGGTASANGPAIRYYNEANNGNLRNLTVEKCVFTNAYQGVYVSHVNGVSVIGCQFNGLGHNAVALQGGEEAVALKTVVISGNTFENIADRVIRFNNVGADSNITITGNTVLANCGDEDGEVMKATSIAAGVTTSISNNTWNGGIVANDELKDK